MKYKFSLVAADWLKDIKIRACSPASRGILVDLMAICSQSGGRLMINGQPIDDAQLARMLGETLADIQTWLAELGAAGAYQVDDDGLYFAWMRVPKRKWPKRTPRTAEQLGLPAAPQSSADRTQAMAPSPVVPTAVQKPTKPAPDWWRTKSGWIRKGNEHAMSKNPDEPFEQYQCRVASRLPMGKHLDVLSLAQVRQVEALKPKQPGT